MEISVDDQAVRVPISSAEERIRAVTPMDRRLENRHMSVLRVGKLIAGGIEELCMIRNISSGGLMAHVYSRHSRGDQVTVEIRSGQMLSGKVAWFQTGQIGVAFDTPIDVLAFLAGEQEHLGGLHARAPRLNMNFRAQLRRGAEYMNATVHDISQGGAKLEPSAELAVDDDIVVMINGLPPVPATVRWTQGNRIGAGFLQVLPFDTLARWAAERRHRAA